MKKTILTIGLFTLVMSITSFATPKILTSSVADNSEITSIDGTGTQDSGRTKKVDYNGNQTTNFSVNKTAKIDGTGTQDSGGNKKVD